MGSWEHSLPLRTPVAAEKLREFSPALAQSCQMFGKLSCNVINNRNINIKLVQKNNSQITFTTISIRVKAQSALQTYCRHCIIQVLWKIMMATPAREIWWVFPQMKFVFLLYAFFCCSTQFEIGNVLSLPVCLCMWVCAILWAGTPNILLYTLFGSRTEQRPHQQRRGRHRRGCLCHRSWLSISLARRGGQKIAGQEATWREYAV